MRSAWSGARRWRLRWHRAVKVLGFAPRDGGLENRRALALRARHRRHELHHGLERYAQCIAGDSIPE